MIKDTRNLLWVVPLALLLAFPLWKPLAVSFLSPERQRGGQTPPSLSGPRVQASSEMEGVQLEQSRKGLREWLLTAARLSNRENNDYMELEEVRALFFNGGGEEEKTRISSRRAQYNAGANRLILEGDVSAKVRQGYEMRTESLEYAESDRKIRTTADVMIRGENIEVTGERLLYDMATGNYSLAGNVVCRLW